VRFYTETGIHKIAYQKNIGHKSQYNKQLRSGCFLNLLSRFHITHFARTVLRFFFVNKRIDFTSQTDPKYRFEEQKYQTDKADNAGYYAICINNDHQYKHSRSQYENFFCFAPTYSGVWLLTIRRARINVGENRGLTNTRIMKSVRNKVMLYFISKKFPFDKIRNSDISSSKNSMPAAALTSRSFKTGMLYPSTSSPNFIILLILIYWF